MKNYTYEEKKAIALKEGRKKIRRQEIIEKCVLTLGISVVVLGTISLIGGCVGIALGIL